MTSNTPLKDLSSSDFVAKMSLYQGQQVKVTVGRGEIAKTYDLPKSLVTYNSRMFDRAFNGGFKEAMELSYNLPDHSPDTFELVIQFMYLGTVTTGRKIKKGITKEEGVEKITRSLNFFILADEIDLLGPFDNLLSELHEVLKATLNTSLTPTHVRQAATKLPKGHAVRKLFADACVKFWLLHTQPAAKGTFAWDFEEEMELESFASDLLRAVGRTGESRTTDPAGGIRVKEPISGEEFLYF